MKNESSKTKVLSLQDLAEVAGGALEQHDRFELAAWSSGSNTCPTVRDDEWSTWSNECRTL